MTVQIHVASDDCIMCGDCYNICPKRAITWQKRELPEFHHEQCTSCLCCVECCPQQALEAKASGFRGLFLKFPEINPPHAAGPSWT
ncbi:MAG: 4Fe-4S binding protein [Thermodesulfobacteriota bacterium]|nr:4Fe-4S binding protein [Thermodesulfobacteriota bacterium]